MEQRITPNFVHLLLLKLNFTIKYSWKRKISQEAIQNFSICHHECKNHFIKDQFLSLGKKLDYANHEGSIGRYMLLELRKEIVWFETPD